MSDHRFALGPGQIITTDDPAAALTEVLAPFGPRLGVVSGGTGLAQLEAAGWTLPDDAEVRIIAAQASDSTVDQVAEWAAERDVLVGVGGGKVLDVAKTAADRADRPVVTVPTSAATCACAASLSVLYREDGGFDRSVGIRRIAAVVLPRLIIAAAPTRLLVAGVFDALAKLPELDWQLRVSGHDLTALPFAPGLARRVAADIFVQLGGELLEWQRTGHAGPAQVRDDTVLACTVGAALVTGTQPPTHAGVAHALYYEHRDRVRRPELLHGEVVGTGILLQLIMNQAPAAEVAAFAAMLAAQGLPTSLDPRILVPTDEVIESWAARCLADPAALASAVGQLG